MPQTDTVTSTPTLEALFNHVTIRNFTKEDISPSVITTLLNAARRSPTSSNMQAYSLVVVRDQEKKAKLAELAGDQRHVAECPVFIAVCADVYRLKKAAEMHGKTLAQNTENTMIATIDAALVGMSLSTAAESIGLGAVMIGSMRNDPELAGKLLGLPKGVYVVYGLCLGWPDEDLRPAQKPRLPEELVIHYEHYSTEDPTPLLKQHDADLAIHYNKLGRNLHQSAWTGVMADKFSTPKRPWLRAVLEKMGFSFE
ncbi:NADPH-dependent oxidoreductase [Phototrophicus methaneseepsis]|uniref:NADPH-dependent oxidoreductase n=1 Tax=Phototrophicus methaneseepsis TaxID=2710758 RepID=A0A7S8IDC1_9CHLR|nr:NADPH-dependent oxidoreductase [Phototrophicus methaneseepsis]QPC82425.1 NADPH-dependent oxidoreductase [Phototrophicus methaneseepsis]